MSHFGICSPLTRFFALCRFFWVFLVGCVGTAEAAPTVLVTVSAVDRTDPAPYELRLRSELATEGVDAFVANPSSAAGDAKRLAARFGANAVVEVTVSAREVTASIWAAEPSLSLEVTRSLRVSTRQRDAVAVFALRAVDFLQGARLELEQQRQSKLAANDSSTSDQAAAASASSPDAESSAAATARPDPNDAVSLKPARSTLIVRQSRVAPQRSSPILDREPAEVGVRERFRFGLGYTVLRSSDVFKWSTAPAITLVWYFKPRWAVGATAIGPYLNNVRETTGRYRVAVDQELFVVELRARLQLGRAFDLEPRAALGGALYSAAGSANPPLVGLHARAMSLITVVGGALVWRIGTHFRLLGGADMLVRWQTPSVRVDGRDMTGTSRWNLLLTAGPAWAF